MTYGALDFYRLGYIDLVSIVPPGATLSPRTTLRAENLGKCPGILTPDGWVGLRHWNQHFIPAEIIEASGANVGIPMGDVCALDIDIKIESISEAVREITETV